MVCPSARAAAGFCPCLFPRPQSVSPWPSDFDLACVSILIARDLETHLQSRAWLWGAALRTSLFYTSLFPLEAGMDFSGPLPSVRPRAALDWRVAQPHAWGPPGRPVPRLCAGGAPAPGEPAESSRSSPASPRGPVTLAAPPSSSWATSAPFPGPCRLSCWTPSRRPVDGSSPSSLSGGPGGSASEQGVLRGGPLSHRGPPSLAGARRRPPVALE